MNHFVKLFELKIALDEFSEWFDFFAFDESFQNFSTLWIIFWFSSLRSRCHLRNSCTSASHLTKYPLKNAWIFTAASSSVHIRDFGRGGLGLYFRKYKLIINLWEWSWNISANNTYEDLSNRVNYKKK